MINMEGSIKSIEKLLEELAGNDETAKNLWHQYSAMKNYLHKEYYPWVQANCPYFTDHGQPHIDCVIQSASQLLSKPSQITITSLDLYLVLCAIIWHDVGMVFKRSGHSSEAKVIIDKIKELGFPDISVNRLVVELVKAHEQADGLKIPEREQDCTIDAKTFTVSPRALAAMVRFSDEISENRSRVSHGLLQDGKIPKENLIYWEYANCVTAARVDPSRERVIVSIEIEVDKAISTHPCPEECRPHSKDGKSLTLIEYLVTRLQKMNNERAYCGREFERYASIREIEVRLRLVEGEQRLERYNDTFVLDDSGIESVRDDTTRRPQIEVFTDFFSQYPHWAPDKIKEVKCT